MFAISTNGIATQVERCAMLDCRNTATWRITWEHDTTCECGDHALADAGSDAWYLGQPVRIEALPVAPIAYGRYGYATRWLRAA